MAILWALREKILTPVNIPLILQTSQKFWDHHGKEMVCPLAKTIRK